MLFLKSSEHRHSEAHNDAVPLDYEFLGCNIRKLWAICVIDNVAIVFFYCRYIHVIASLIPSPPMLVTLISSL